MSLPGQSETSPADQTARRRKPLPATHRYRPIVLLVTTALVGMIAGCGPAPGSAVAERSTSVLDRRARLPRTRTAIAAIDSTKKLWTFVGIVAASFIGLVTAIVGLSILLG
jgi:hypothetical protein